MATTTPSQGILSPDRASEREELLALLTKAYWMEIETLMSYMANSINPDGVRAQEIIESLEADVGEELGHARQFGERIKELYGVVPGSLGRPGHPGQVLTILRDEEQHRRLFEGFLREYEAEGLA